MKTAKELIDEVIECIREICHRHGESPLTKEYLEYALAFLQEAWIDIDGQQARPVHALFEEMERVRFALEAAVTKNEAGK